MNALTRIPIDTEKLNAKFPRDRAMIIGGWDTKGSGAMMERASPAHGVAVTADLIDRDAQFWRSFAGPETEQSGVESGP